MRTLIHDSHTNGTKAVCLCGTFGHSESVSEAACSRSEWCPTASSTPRRKYKHSKAQSKTHESRVRQIRSAPIYIHELFCKCAAISIHAQVAAISIHAQVCSNQHSFTWSIKSNSRTCQHPASHPLVTRPVTQSASQPVTQPVRQRQ